MLRNTRTSAIAATLVLGTEMQFDYEQLENGSWVVSYEELDVKVTCANKAVGTDALLAVIIRYCNVMLGIYGRLLGEAQEALETLEQSKGKERH